MSSAYTDVVFSSRQPDQPTATKLNKLRDDLSAAIASSGGGTGTGDMTKAVYDVNGNGVVDTADSIPWGSVTGKPATFPPDSTAMLKSVYDTNADNIVDHAALADTAPWTGITGKPATFAPSAHATTHVAGGGDVIPVPTTSATGLVPVLPATLGTSKFLRGDATFAQPDWANLTNVPASFTPAAHATTHKSGGSDAIALDTLAATTDITTLNSSTTAHGLCPKLPGTTTTFLRGDGTWVAPAGGGDMTKAVYDTNANNVVDTCDSLAWGKLTGVPTTFTPAAHASTHVTGGSDVIPAPTTSASGLVPVLPASPANMKYLDGSGAFNPVWKGLLSKSAAYNLVAADSGNYVICTGGSWALGLPAPVLGLVYYVRNDMGISGTTGTITITPASGTIDGAATLKLLAGQECQIITDGTNWRTFGRQREVIIGVLDAGAGPTSVLLPAGYRFYELVIEDIRPGADNNNLNMLVSTDGGSTWLTSALYYDSYMYDNAATTVAFSVSATAASGRVSSPILTNAGTISGSVYVRLWPGDGVKNPHWNFDAGGWEGTPGRLGKTVGWGMYNSAVIINAVQYNGNTINLVSSRLTVKGSI